MTEAVKNFIETNYELLDSDPNNFFMTAYNGLSIHQQGELINILKEAGIEFEKSRDAVLRFILTMNLDDLDYSICLTTYIERYLSGILGYRFSELFEIILEDANEFDVDIVFKNDRYTIYPRT